MTEADVASRVDLSLVDTSLDLSCQTTRDQDCGRPVAWLAIFSCHEEERPVCVYHKEVWERDMEPLRSVAFLKCSDCGAGLVPTSAWISWRLI